MQRSKRSVNSVKQWSADVWVGFLGWWRRNTTDPNPKVAEFFRVFFWLSALKTLMFSLAAVFDYTDYRRLMHTCMATFCGGVAALCYAVLRERRRMIP